MNIYYVYAYMRRDLTPYYIGKGKGRRAWTKHTGIGLPTNKSQIIIVENNLTEIGALAIERKLIKWYGRKDLGTGILRNRTDGGDGGINKISVTKGIPRTDAVKEKLRQANIGKKKSAETIRKLSVASQLLWTDERRKKQSQRNSGAGNPRYGVKLTLETITKIKDKVPKTPIYCITNNIIYKSQQDAARQLNIKQSDIANVLGGRQKSTKGYAFTYIEK